MRQSNEPAFFLVRHSEPQYDFAEARRLKGGMRDWVPLTELGKEQAAAAAQRLAGRAYNPQILSSPMTRALQTAAIIGSQLDLPLHVEFDLHEWQPDLTHSYDSAAFVSQQQKELDEYAGEWPEGVERPWEPLSRVRERVMAVLEQYKSDRPTIVVCHGTVIYSLTGQKVAYGEIVPFTP